MPLSKWIKKLGKRIRMFFTSKHTHAKGRPGDGVRNNKKGHRLPLASMWGLSEERKLARLAAIESVSKSFKKRIDSL